MVRTELVNQAVEFLETYYQEPVQQLAAAYPDQQSVSVEYSDLYTFDSGLAQDYLDNHEIVQEALDKGLERVTTGVDVSLANATVRVTDTDEYLERLGIGDLREDHMGEYVALRCQIGKVSEREPRLQMAAFECLRCGAIQEIPQTFMDTQEPGECGCERNGPFELDESQSEFVDQRKLLLEAPPEKQSDGELTAYCLGDLADATDGQLMNNAGARVTVLGKLEGDMSSLFGRGQNEPVPDRYFVPKAFIWGEDVSNEVDVDDHRSEVKDLASQENAIETFARSIDPDLVLIDEWPTAIKMATAYLFGAPRISPEGGKTYRGDIHFLFVSDPGMNKSSFASKIAELSPKGVKKDAEGMSSEVGLTAAATRGGFGDDSWSIEPGALPKANNGHLILDEIDKGPNGFMNGIHGPLEGEQVLNVEKAGQEANLSTRAGLLALGNPVDGEFDPYGEDISAQIDLHAALMSRFDLICAMTDTADREMDSMVAEGVLDSIEENANNQFGDDTEEPAIDRDVLKAWVKLARTEINPKLTDKAKQTLQEYYVETRDRNDDETPAITARTLLAGWRVACAFARCELSETVDKRHAELAKEIVDTTVSLNFDPETGDFDANKTTESPSNQSERMKAIEKTLRDADFEGNGMTAAEVAEETGIDTDRVEDGIDKLKQKGEVYEPETSTFRWT